MDITVECDDVKSQIKNGKAIAFDLGWRKESENIYRFATWTDSDGNCGIHTVDLSLTNKVEDLKSIIDVYFNNIKDLLYYFNKEAIVPDLFKRTLNNVSRIRSYKKLLKLFNLWGKNRFYGDEEIFVWFKYWKERHIHLNNYMIGIQRALLRWRKQEFSNLAKKLSEKYEYVVFENLELDNMAKGKVAGGNRFKISPSEFKKCFEYRFEKENIKEIEAKYTSKIHFMCGSIEDLDGKVTKHTCTKCNVTYDRDINASKNILERGLSEIKQICQLPNNFGEPTVELHNIRGAVYTGCERESDAESAGGARNDQNTNEIKMLPRAQILKQGIVQSEKIGSSGPLANLPLT